MCEDGPPAEFPPEEPPADPVVEFIREESLDGPEDDLLLPSFSDMMKLFIRGALSNEERFCMNKKQTIK